MIEDIIEIDDMVYVIHDNGVNEWLPKSSLEKIGYRSKGEDNG